MAVTLVYEIDDYDLEDVRGPMPNDRYVEYECEPTLEDCFDFLFPLARQNEMSEGYTSPICFKMGMEAAIKTLLEEWDWVKDALEEDEDFKEYLKEAYRDEALYSGD